MFILPTANLVDLTKDLIHPLQSHTFGFGPEQNHDNQTDHIDADENVVSVVTDMVEHDGPGLVDPEGGELLTGLGDVDALVTVLVGEDLRGVDPCGGTEGSGICHFDYVDEDHLDDGCGAVEVCCGGIDVSEGADDDVADNLDVLSVRGDGNENELLEVNLPWLMNQISM